ncbi:primosomal protein N' [Pseudooceanicola algae]|uniref:Replication restart protein PriA n=1 Tax=Pseudooceanicola algae TaxID=1537215 RepID=A0A418SH29_9RHOB|nr:primosomal protein N' [Pseudooceanicola algae]QPM88918.1 Primosomal protein N' [Pseudooceanicola algae]
MSALADHPTDSQPAYAAPQPQGWYDEGTLVAVLTTQPLDRTLDYRAPEGGVAAGAFVQVPLGPRQVIGVVWGKGQGGFDLKKARAITRILDVAPMREEMQDFLIRAGEYTLTPLPTMLRLATRAPGLSDPPSMRKVYGLGPATPDRMTEARTRVLAVLEDFGGAGFTLKELAEAAEVSASVIKGMVAQDAVLELEAPRDTAYPRLDPSLPGKPLTDSQTRAADQLRTAIQGGTYGTTLLRGVTGSGKTEVYLEAVAACLAKGRQALVLLPEIALSAEFLTRVEQRFGAKPVEWHSGVTMTERRRAWKMIGQGGAQLVVGARSALFLPFRDLGLIVVDEEHDSSYKQEDGALYNARDMSVLRASLAGAQVVLASATPSLETWVNAKAGKYARIDMTDRFGAAVLPEMRAIDMRAEALSPGRWISPTLQQAVRDRMAAGEQALLFLNRRGYAPVTICRACGHQVQCDHCDARMVEHRFLKRLVCHQCGESKPMPTECPSCKVEGKLSAVGPGVERLTEEAAEVFPEARIATLSSDLFGSARALKQAVGVIANGGADIVVGTQLVAKGHNFPLLTLVGVIDADLGLHGSDMRAAERTFQLMRQVSGRAGRADRPGQALLQTCQPDHPVIRAILSGAEEDFWNAEAEGRAAAGMPPFGRMAGIILSAEKEDVAMAAGVALARADQPLRLAGAVVYGPALAPIARVRGWHRVRMLVKAPKGVALQRALGEWIAGVRLPKGLRLSVDVDPQSFY